MRTIWIQSFLDRGGPGHGEVIDCLRNLGFDIAPFDLAASYGPGVVFFDRISPQLHSFVAGVLNDGECHLLGVAPSHAELVHSELWALLSSGMRDVVTWDRPHETAERIAARIDRWETVESLIRSPAVQKRLIGQSAAWLAVIRQVVEMAALTDAPTLLLGESGTGKELVARAIHELDSRPGKGDFVLLDCTTVVPELSGSEFFGHERGAFTGAVSSREGAFSLANGGTLFLDEVGELPLALQAQLLRVIQERTYKAVGGNTWKHTDFRLVCATNRELLSEVAAGRFRADLYYRLAGCIYRLPPLRGRPADILPLTMHFIQQMHPDNEAPQVERPVEHLLLSREYPGNVRDLKQLVSRILYRHVGPGPITIGDVPEDERPTSAACEQWRQQGFMQAIEHAVSLGVGLKELGRTAQDIAEQTALRLTGGNLHMAAQRLGITDRALQLRRAARRSVNRAGSGEAARFSAGTAS